MADRFDKFTASARRVLTLAQEEAQRFGHNYIGTEHILLGLVREGDANCTRALDNLGVTLDKVRLAVEFIIGHRDRVTAEESGLSPRSKRVIELAVDEALRLESRYVGPGHLLLGLVREGEGIAAGVLGSLGVTLEKLRSELDWLLEGSVPVELSTGVLPDSGGADLGPLVAGFGFAPQPDAPTLSKLAQLALSQAVEEARQNPRMLKGHFMVEQHHLLLALLKQNEGIAARALEKLGFELARVATATTAINSEVVAARAGQSRQFRIIGQALQRANDAAAKSGATVVTTGHLLIGMIEDKTSLTAILLLAMGGPSPQVIRDTINSLIADAGINEV